jgi:hypothetical protein
MKAGLALTMFLSLCLLFSDSVAQVQETWAIPGVDDLELVADILAVSEGRQPYLALNEGFKTGSIGIPVTTSILGQQRNELNPEVVQVVDSENVILSSNGILLWLSGVDTRNLTDDSRLRLNKPCRAVGTRSYESILGAKKTVLHLEVIDLPSEVVQIQKELAEVPLKEWQLRIRKWQVNKEKEELLYARFLSFDGKQLELELRDRSVVTFSAKQLPSATKTSAKRLSKFVETQRKKSVLGKKEN